MTALNLSPHPKDFDMREVGKPPIVITMGDAAGIGPEIIIKALQTHPQALQGCFVVGDVATMRRAAALVAACSRQLQMPIAMIESTNQVAQMPPNCLAVLQIGKSLEPVPWGQVSKVAGSFAGQCVQWAADAALRGEVAAIVTAPLHKEAMAMAGPPYDQFPGHTELLQARAASYLDKAVDDVPVRMMLANDELRTVLVSIHVSLRQAIEAVTVKRVLDTLSITHKGLLSLLGRAPRMAVAGLNPHAGEGGLFGREEVDIIGPAIEAGRGLGYLVSGPWAPDTVFMRARRKSGGGPNLMWLSPCTTIKG